MARKNTKQAEGNALPGLDPEGSAALPTTESQDSQESSGDSSTDSSSASSGGAPDSASDDEQLGSSEGAEGAEAEDAGSAEDPPKAGDQVWFNYVRNGAGQVHAKAEVLRRCDGKDPQDLGMVDLRFRMPSGAAAIRNAVPRARAPGEVNCWETIPEQGGV